MAKTLREQRAEILAAAMAEMETIVSANENEVLTDDDAETMRKQVQEETRKALAGLGKGANES